MPDIEVRTSVPPISEVASPMEETVMSMRVPRAAKGGRSAVTITAALIAVACSQNTDLVSPDYYERELRFQGQIDQVERTFGVFLPQLNHSERIEDFR